MQHFWRDPNRWSLHLDLLLNMACLIAKKIAELDIQDFTCVYEIICCMKSGPARHIILCILRAYA